MNNLTSQLKSLKREVSPRSDWKRQNRDLLVSQIYGNNTNVERPEDVNWTSYIFRGLPVYALRTMSQPAMVVLFVFLIVLAGGFASSKVAKNTKPGDSLYIAKIISEKTQLALTFDEKKKAQLRIGFASNRAEELDQVLAESDNTEEGNTKEKVEKLITDYKKEIIAAKTGLEKVNDTNKENDIDEGMVEEGSNQVFSASIGKTEKGISISDSSVKEESENSKTVTTTTEDIIAEPVDSASTTATTSDSLTITEEASSKSILVQVEELLKTDDVETAISILDTAGEALEGKGDSGEVKGVSEEATSTAVIIEDEVASSTD